MRRRQRPSVRRPRPGSSAAPDRVRRRRAPRGTAERTVGQRAGDRRPVAGGDEVDRGSRHDLANRAAGGGDDAQPGRHRLDQHQAELLLPERPRHIERVVAGHRRALAGQHHRRRGCEQRRHFVVWRAADLDPALKAELAGIGAQSPLLRAAADDRQPDRGGIAGRRHDSAIEQCERSNDVLVTLFPHQASGRDHQVARGRRRRGVCAGEAIDIDARRRNPDLLGANAFQAECQRRPVGRGEKQIGLGKHQLPVDACASIPERGQQWERLPHRLNEAETQAAPAPGCLCGKPERELLAVDDVGPGERFVRGQISVAEGRGGHFPERPPRDQITERAHSNVVQAARRGEPIRARE